MGRELKLEVECPQCEVEYVSAGTAPLLQGVKGALSETGDAATWLKSHTDNHPDHEPSVTLSYPFVTERRLP